MRKLLHGSTFLFSLIFLGCQSTNNSIEREGLTLFKTYCVNCHGFDGSLMINGAKNLKFSILSLDERILVVSQGRNSMTSFKYVLTDKQIETVAKYSIQLADSTFHAR